MIADSLQNAYLYNIISPKLAQGFAWLAQFDASTPDGRYDIDGDEVFAMVQSYTSAPASEKKFEAHRKYTDIQFLVSGTEIMLCTPVSGLVPATEFDAKKDIVFFAEPTTSTIIQCVPGTFTVFFPHDGHKPGCSVSGPTAIRKVVVKVAV